VRIRSVRATRMCGWYSTVPSVLRECGYGRYFMGYNLIGGCFWYVSTTVFFTIKKTVQISKYVVQDMFCFTPSWLLLFPRLILLNLVRGVGVVVECMTGRQAQAMCLPTIHDIPTPYVHQCSNLNFDISTCRLAHVRSSIAIVRPSWYINSN